MSLDLEEIAIEHQTKAREDYIVIQRHIAAGYLLAAKRRQQYALASGFWARYNLLRLLGYSSDDAYREAK